MWREPADGSSWFLHAVEVLRSLQEVGAPAEESRKAGARRISEKVEQALHRPPANLRGPEQVKQDLACRTSAFAALRTQEDWERAKLQLVLDKLAEGTKKSYGVGWRWWELFCKAPGVPHYARSDRRTDARKKTCNWSS